MLKKQTLCFICFICCTLFNKVNAQLGFCNGNSGAPIFTEDFGVGTSSSPLPAGTTTYSFTSGFPDDGFYSVLNGTFGNPFDWHQIQDHTPGDTNGRLLVVNASFAAGEFYRTTVSGLCETTTYEFSAWLVNLLIPNTFCSTQPSGAIPINVRFEIWDSTDTNLLASGNTGDIIETSSPNWQEYGLVFQTLAGQDTVILKMINNGVGGCGNDLAIDDIEFKSCGDTVSVSDASNNSAVTLCSTQTPLADTLTALPDFAVFSSHFYQWQESTDGINWNDIVGETSQNLSISTSTTTYYRAKIAEVAINISNPQCVIFSDEYLVNVNQLPPMPSIECWETASINDATCSWDITGTQPPPPTIECWETATFNNTTCSWEVSGAQPPPPTVECWENTTFNNTTCIWEVTGTQPPPPTIECWETATFNNTTCAWEVSGTQPPPPTIECWETTTFNNTICIWEVTGAQPPPPPTECWEVATFNNSICVWEVSGTQPLEPITSCNEEAVFNSTTCLWEVNQISIEPVLQTLFFCGNEIIQLSADIDNASYVWNTGETSRDIIVNEAGVYSVEIIDQQGCIFQKVITLSNYDLPVIESVVSNGTSIIVNTVNSGNYEYSIDGIGYQLSNVFNGVEGDYYTVYVRSVYGCLPDQFQYLHFVIPKVMTPNGDSYNDTFSLKGIEFYESSEVYIFDRYGKLLKSTKNSPLNWDGTFNNLLLPSDDYWYLINIEGQVFRGHFTLKR